MAGGNELTSRITGLFERIQDTIYKHWKIPDQDGEYLTILRQVFFVNSDKNSPKIHFTNRWVLLPGLCCQAVGGKEIDADIFSSAWFLYYIAAHIMDSVQDGDELPSFSQLSNPAVALNVASGLFFTGNLLFIETAEKFQNNSIILPLIKEFNQKMLGMCDGQHQDLTTTQVNLESYWRIAHKKSGTFFELACKIGASMGTSDISRIKLLSDYGLHLGVLIQILDDLEEWNVTINSKTRTESRDIWKTLPIVYALDILPEQERDELLNFLENNPDNPAIWDNIMQKIEQCGATLFLLTEMERYRINALNTLNQANPENEAGENLRNLLESLFIPKY